ncbi:MlaD family protein [Flavobacterium granuli]|uniref:Phospholipid/cholesterol/gamma-HCH transport system substrate-binding protein n=1 Tax=Flavobacterium granuli TaxID=280093 RepID=A0A1M5NVR8_9FLAO|nr:MlaD family protein [Flavobacterium granuli]PRZ23413.1 phospholipid/cholesterol/gamma-HCH transport system substrate-binding protein [Flavobacterium granuli]SHG93568.1 phospholipid/cholesterol/gamma-HCH transport system substrate-binding protein [Flavobacterium granuli]
MHKESSFTWKLGMFVTIGLVLFIGTIYFIGKQKNLFGATFNLKSQFKTVSGLKVGNNVRFSGINVGTVDGIELINDSSVVVKLVLRKEVQQFIKTDARAAIGSDGLMGDKVLTIYPGTLSKNTIKNNGTIASNKAIEMEDIMKGVKTTLDNATIITDQLAEFSYKINNGKGTLSKLLSDEKMGQKLDASLSNLESGTKGFNQNMEAAKHNFLLKGYFNKKEKAEAKKQKQIQKELKKESKSNNEQ